MGVIKRIHKPVTHKGKKFLKKKEPAVVEECKQTLFMRGRKTNTKLLETFRDLYALKKPDAVIMSKKNEILPFENISPLEGFCRKFSCSMFAFASSNKKRPSSLIFGRTYDGNLLDMMELNVTKMKTMNEFDGEKISLGLKSCLLFAGVEFETKPELIRLKNMLIDFFQREAVPVIRLQGLEHVLMFTAVKETIYLRSYRVMLKNSGVASPRVELVEVGPSLDMELGRMKLASDDLFKTACKKPKELRTKKVKNIATNVFGTKEARIHISKQNVSRVQTRKMKGLRRVPKTPIKT